MVNCADVKTKFFNKNRLSEISDGFFYSALYPVIVAVMAVFCFITKMQLGGIAFIFIIGSYLLVTHRDATPIIPLPLFFMMFIRDVSVTGNLVFYLMIIPVAICLIIHFVRFPLKHFNFGKMFLPLCVVTGALFLGGVLSPYVNAYDKGLLYTLPLGPVVFIVYLYFANYIEYPEDFDFKKYVCVILMLLGLVASAEFFYYDMHFNYLGTKLFEFGELGWGNMNVAGSMILIAIPATCYLLTKSKSVFPCVLTVITFYYTLYETGSDGCLGISAIFLPFLVFFCYSRSTGKNKKIFNFTVFLFACFVVIALIYLSATDKMFYITDVIEKATNGDSGRSKLYRDAWRVFNDNPVFGVGFGYYNSYLYSPVSSDQLRLFNYHSTLFQVLGSMGIFGFCAYFYYFYARISVLTQKNEDFNVFAFFSFVMFACYGFIDTVEFSTVPCVLTITMLILSTEFINAEETPLKRLKEF